MGGVTRTLGYHPHRQTPGNRGNVLRPRPQCPIAEPADGYLKLLAHGWDTWIETYDGVKFSDNAAAKLNEAQEAAKRLDRRNKAKVAIGYGNELYQAAAHGGGTATWIIGNDDMTIDIRQSAPSHQVTVRYSSAGLWEHGLAALRKRAADTLNHAFHYTRTDDYTAAALKSCIVNAAHYAFDFHSPDFGREMVKPTTLDGYALRPAVVCHPEVKIDWTGNSARDETLTIGKSRAGLIVQIYDKALEIRQSSGKTWMYDQWAKALDGEIVEFERDVWRVETRFGKDFLKNRNLRTPAGVERMKEALITDALYKHRLCQPNWSDSNRRRWPMHPLYTAAWRAAGIDGVIPPGRIITERRSALMKQFEAQIAGSVRSYAVLTGADFKEAMDNLLLQLPEIVNSDPGHGEKIEKAEERYRFVDEAG